MERTAGIQEAKKHKTRNGDRQEAIVMQVMWLGSIQKAKR